MWYWIIVALLVSGCAAMLFVSFSGIKQSKAELARAEGRGRKKRRDEYEDEYEAEVCTRSKREREAQAYAKDQRPKRKKRRWKIILEDIDSWEKYSFTFCDSVGIGRGKDGSMYERYLPLTSDGRISKLHCVIIHKNDKLYVKDEDSRNGTYLNGVRIDRPMEIQRDDIIGVGETRLEVQIEKNSPFCGKADSCRTVKRAVCRIGSGAFLAVTFSGNEHIVHI